MQNFEEIKKEFEDKLSSIASLNDLENFSIRYLGRNGVINKLLQNIKDLQPDKKKEFGKKINHLKNSINQLIELKKTSLNNSQSEKTIDITLPGKLYPKGSLHPITYTIEEIDRIFKKIGFIRVSYPEVDWEYFAFEVLNMPDSHPARDDFETFFIDQPAKKKFGKMVLTPHTSNGQNREMRRIGKTLPAGRQAPIRMINIAKCYRPNWDITHNPMFYQFEGLCVDKNINITHLKGTINYFAKEFFGQDREIRLRPCHFQFTEPSFEIDVSCGACMGHGLGCRVCKSGWLELGGSGMVHPNVLRAGGINPEIYSGWAFGFGPERCLMMKSAINDIRILYECDIRFLEQF